MKYQINQKYKDIWWEAFDYQDARNDRGHAFIVTIYAQDICKREECDVDVVVPAAILHDIGWSQLNEQERMLIFDKSIPKEDRLKMRYKHQEYSVDLAEKILKRLNHSKELIPEILEIISQHDTREGFISSNEGAMRDADKLWRFDDHGFLNDNQNSKVTFDKHFVALEKYLDNESFFYFDSSKELAVEKLGCLKSKYFD